jgi:hypothetical protein
MSRRARNRPDKREEAMKLARFFGHGTPLPAEEQADPAWVPEVPEDDFRANATGRSSSSLSKTLPGDCAMRGPFSSLE